MNATLARVALGTFTVSAMNDGMTANGLTIVTSAVNESRATFQSGIFLIARLLGCLGYRLPGCRVTGLPGYRVAGLPGCRVTGLPERSVIRQPGNQATRQGQPGNRVTW